MQLTTFVEFHGQNYRSHGHGSGRRNWFNGIPQSSEILLILSGTLSAIPGYLGPKTISATKIRPR